MTPRPDRARQPRLHVVANRLPMTWSSGGWARAPGGLVTALDAVTRRHRVPWIGSTASLGDLSAPTPQWRFGALRAVDVDAPLASRAVAGMANSALWPALHGMHDHVRWRDDWWEGYVEFNERFARAVADTAERGDLVWIHDYHLLLVPQVLARIRPDLVVGHSLHTPIDAAITALPTAAQMLRALGSASLVTVQTAADRDLLEPMLGRAVVTAPVSIDPEALGSLLDERATRALVERHRQHVGGRLLVVGVDRLDPTKAIPQRLSAIDDAFRRGWIDPDDVDIVQVAQPSREDVSGSRELRLEVERRAHDIASNWLRSDATPPLRVLSDALDRREVAAVLAAADVALVTPVRDGMNLVAKEFSICNEERGGVLVLGAGAGAAAELGPGSVMVDGGDPSSVADGLRQAVQLSPGARREMATARADAVRSWTSQRWSDDVERRLLTVATRRRPSREVWRHDASG